MTKPTIVPTWATNASTRVQPSSQKQGAGWGPGERPGPRVWNWLMGTAGDWLTFFDGIFASDGAITVPSIHITGATTAIIPWADAYPATSGPTTTGLGWALGTSTTRLTYPVRRQVGDKISAWTVNANKVSGSGSISAQLAKINANTKTETGFGVAVTFPSSSGYTSLAAQLGRSGTAQGGAASSITLDAGASATNNFYNNLTVKILTGPGAGTSNTISAYVGATKVATTAAPWSGASPTSASTFEIFADTSNSQEDFYIIFTGGGTNGPDFAYHASYTFTRP